MPSQLDPSDLSSSPQEAASIGNTPAGDRRDNAEHFWIIAACFFVSGFAALLYETVWLRQFAILLGTSEQALAIVLATYMGGLAFGSWIASRKVDTIARPLFVYGLLEFGIAVTALLVPLGLWLARLFQSRWLGGLPEPSPAGTISQSIFNFATTVGLILIPTALMGATLPLLARHVVQRNEELGPRISLLYSINTAGAVMGTLVAAFALMPAVGMRATTWVGAAANFGVFLLVLWLVRRTRFSSSICDSINAGDPLRRPKDTSLQKEKSSKQSVHGYRRVIGLMGIGGAVSFCCEIVFTRMLGHFLGGSIYAFASMLSGFLLGISIGGMVASRFAKHRHNAAVAFIYTQLGAALCTLLAYRTLEATTGLDWTTEDGPSFGRVILAISMLVPTATCIGMAFPLAIRVLARDESEAASASAMIYSISTIGGIVGAIATGTVLLPFLAYRGTVSLAVLGSILIGATAVLAWRLPRKHLSVVGIAVLILVVLRPSYPENIIRISALNLRPTPGKIVFNRVGKSATVTVFEHRKKLRFQTNGLSEALIPGVETGNASSHEGTWLGALPTILRPGTESMMIIGLGGGGTASGIPPSMKEVDVVELSATVIEANRAVAELRQHDPLQDPRIRLIVNDARSALTLTSRQYDSIVSQPSHPWTAGASHLYTREFCEIAKQHLRPGGVFLQWMSDEFVDAELLGNMASTISSVFPHVRIYQPVGGSLMFVGSDRPIRPEAENRLQVNPEDQAFYFRIGGAGIEDLMTILVADERGIAELAKGSARILDERNLLAMRSPTLVHRSKEKEIGQSLAQIHPLTYGAEHVNSLGPSIDVGRLLMRLDSVGSTDLVRQHGLDLTENEAERKFLAATLDRTTHGNQSWIDFLNGQRQTRHQTTAFHVLRVDATGLIQPRLSEEEQGRLNSLLSDRHRKIIEIFKATRKNDFALAEEEDEFLAEFNPSDLGFEEAFKMRLPWRLSKTGEERIRKASEAISLIDQHGAFIKFIDTATLRATAGLLSGREEVAMATADEVISSLEMYHIENEYAPPRSLLTTFGRIGSLLSNPIYLPNTPRDEYQQLMDRFVQMNETLSSRIR